MVMRLKEKPNPIGETWRDPGRAELTGYAYR